MPGEDQHKVELIVGDPDEDPAAVSEASDLLLAELALLDFDRLDRLNETERKPGTRSGTAVVVGTLIGLFSSPVVLRGAVDVATSWLGRQQRGSVTVKCDDDTLELSAASRAQQEALINAFLDRHARG